LDTSTNQAKQQTNTLHDIKIAGRLLSFGATVIVCIDGEGLLPIITVCLV
jgi:hypothetical protein